MKKQKRASVTRFSDCSSRTDSMYCRNAVNEWRPSSESALIEFNCSRRAPPACCDDDDDDDDEAGIGISDMVNGSGEASASGAGEAGVDDDANGDDDDDDGDDDRDEVEPEPADDGACVGVMGGRPAPSSAEPLSDRV